MCIEKDRCAALQDKFSGAAGETGVIAGITGDV